MTFEWMLFNDGDNSYPVVGVEAPTACKICLSTVANKACVLFLVIMSEKDSQNFLFL